MTATTTFPKTFLDNLNLPFPTDDPRWQYTHLAPIPLKWTLAITYEVKNPERLAEIIHQIHYWISMCQGKKKQGFRWIYNTIEKWQSTQFFWMRENALWRAIRFLEEIGWVISSNYNGNPFEREKWYTLDYVKIFIDTKGIWNPWDLDPDRIDDYPRPPKFTKGLSLGSTRDVDDDTPLAYIVEEEQKPQPEDSSSKYTSSSAENPTVVDFSQMQNGDNASVSFQISLAQNHLYTKKTSISTKSGENSKKRKEANQQEEITQNSVNVKELNQISGQPIKTWIETNIPPRQQAVENFGKSPEYQSEQKESVNADNQLSDYVIEEVDGKCVFGIYNGEYVVPSDLVRWRANTKYVPQGGQWEASARSHAAAELTRCLRENREKAKWIWQDFLEYAERSADSSLAVAATVAANPKCGVQPTLPKAFEDDTRNTTEVAAKLAQAKSEVQKVQVAKAALEAASVAELPPACETSEERFWRETRLKLERHQISWKNFKDRPKRQQLLNRVIEVVQNTPGLIMTPDGPDLDPNYVFISKTGDDDPDDDCGQA